MEIDLIFTEKMVTYKTNDILSHVLTPEGAQISLEGSHEARVWDILPHKGQGAPMTINELRSRLGEETAKVGQGNAFKNRWIGKEGDGFVRLVGFVHLSLCAIQSSHPTSGFGNQRRHKA